MISVVDTHSHLDTRAFDQDREQVIERALAAGVHAIVLIAYDPERWSACTRLSEQYPFLVRSVGIHPNSAGIWSDTVAQRLADELALGDAVAVGEIGLDFFREHAAPDLQREAFKAQLSLAKRAGLPVIIHQRNAEDEVVAAIESHAPVLGVMHCFSGDLTFARRCIAAGLHLGIGGVATYPRSTDVRDAIAETELGRLVVETDAPYLAPQGHRGERNEPAWIRKALDTIAEIHAVPAEQVAAITTSNAERLFGPRLVAARARGMELAECHS